MPFTYGLYPWQWTNVDGMFSHAPPTGAAAVLDFRPLPEQAKQGQSGGYGFFAWLNPQDVPGDAVALGVGDCRTLQPTTAQRGNIKTALGLASNPTGTFLSDCLAAVLGELSDPTGASGPKPLMPQSDGVEVILLAGHSPVWSRAYQPAAVLAQNPTGRANRQRDVFRASMLAAFNAGGEPLLAKALGALLLQHGYSRAEVAAGAPAKAQEWRRLLPSSLLSQLGGQFRPVLPGTSYSDSFPTNCADISATPQDQSWTVFGAIQVSGGRAQATSAFTNRWGICSAAVSSVNHIASADAWEVLGRASAAARARPGAVTGYTCGRELGSRQLAKFVAGTRTVLMAEAKLGARYSCRANGSTITAGSTGQTSYDATDTAISDGLYGGILLYIDAPVTTYAELDNFTIDDELPSAPVADFTATPLSGTAPLSVAFTDASTNTPTSWLWEKSSDGGSNWGNFASGHTSQNPTEEFTAGTWSIRLTATNAGGSDSETKLAYITVTAPASGGRNRLSFGLGLGLN